MNDFGKGVMSTMAGFFITIIIIAILWPYIQIGEQPMEPKLPQKTYTYYICHEPVVFGPDLKHYYSLDEAEGFVLDMFEPGSVYVAAYIKIFKVHPDRDWETASNESGIPRPLAIHRRLVAYGYHVDRVEYTEAGALKAEEIPVWEWDEDTKNWIPRKETITL